MPAKGLIVEGTFTSIPDVFEQHAWGWLPLGPLITQRFESLAKIGHVSAPMLVVHGTARHSDPARARVRFTSAPLPKRLVLVERRLALRHQLGRRRAVSEALHELFGLAQRPAPVASAE